MFANNLTEISKLNNHTDRLQISCTNAKFGRRFGNDSQTVDANAARRRRASRGINRRRPGPSVGRPLLERLPCVSRHPCDETVGRATTGAQPGGRGIGHMGYRADAYREICCSRFRFKGISELFDAHPGLSPSETRDRLSPSALGETPSARRGRSSNHGDSLV